jgi:hypothetical protein
LDCLGRAQGKHLPWEVNKSVNKISVTVDMYYRLKGGQYLARKVSVLYTGEEG